MIYKLPSVLFQSMTMPMKGDIGKLNNRITAYKDIYPGAETKIKKNHFDIRWFYC